GLVQVGGHSIADRYTYIPLIGIFILLVWWGSDFSQKWRYGTVVLSGICVAAIGVCTAMTAWHIQFWRDSETLFRRSLAITEAHSLPRLNLRVTIGKKSPSEALKQLQMALKAAPGNPDLQLTVGNAMIRIGYPYEAIPVLAASFAGDPSQPRALLAL